MNFPKQLFRYRSSKTKYFEEELKRALRGEIFLSSADQLNDPFDFRPVHQKSEVRDVLALLRKIYGRKPIFSKEGFQGTLGRELLRGEYRSRSAKMRPSVATAKLTIKLNEGLFLEFPQQARLACFSEKKHNIPMWAHYAADHSGVCLSYRVNLNRLDVTKLAPLEVIYQQQRPILTTVDMMNFTDREMEKLTGEVSRTQVMQAIYLRKSEDWSYEQEWRIFDNASDAPKYRYIRLLELDSIVVGLRAQPETVDLVKGIVGGKVPIFGLKALRSDFGFHEVSL